MSFSETIYANSKVPGMLKATFTSTAKESGGDFSMDVFTKKIAPYDHFVGIAAPAADSYGSYETGKDVNFDLISVDKDGQVAPNRDLKVLIHKISWRWWWYRGSDDLDRYENTSYYKPIKSFDIKTNSYGKVRMPININEDDGGRYLIRIIDEASGHSTSVVKYFFKDWWSLETGSSERPKYSCSVQKRKNTT